MNHCSIAYTFYEIDYRVRRYAEALVGAGNRVDVIALDSDDKNRCETLNGVNISHLQKRKFNEKSRFSYLFNILKFFIKGSIILLLKHLKYRYKIIHIHNVPDFLVFMAVIPKFLGAKIILDIHDILPEFYCQKFDMRFDSFLTNSLLHVEKLSVRFADHVIVANDLWRRKIIYRDKILPQKCTALLNYPKLEFFEGFQDKSKKDGLKIIYPGHLSYHHGIDIAIKAIDTVKKQVPSVKLDIYASSWIRDYRQFLVNLIDDLKLQDNITFCDPVKVEELAKIYEDVSMGIVPKRAGIFASEAFSSKIFDFMAAGLPIIASKTKIDEYYFNDSMMMFFEPENSDDLARCIIELYNNPEKRKSLSEKEKEFVEENNWEIKKHIYLDVTDSLCH